ncbi:MAG: hypothetical protein LUE21_12115 [Oscillospiraceae bacterium]|nr:hypothetical protein [Oscillospiraceae bacterium]
MKVWKIISGVVSIFFSLITLYAEFMNEIARSATDGYVFLWGLGACLLVLVGGTVAVSTSNSKSVVSCAWTVVLYGAAMILDICIGVWTNNGNAQFSSDFMLWCIWNLICMMVAVISIATTVSQSQQLEENSSQTISSHDNTYHTNSNASVKRPGLINAVTVLCVIVVALVFFATRGKNDSEVADSGRTSSAVSSTVESSSATTRPTSTTKPTEAPAASIETPVVYDENGITITATAINDDSIDFTIVNDADFDIYVQFSYLVVNGASATGVMWCDVATGKKANTTLYFTDLDYLNITEIVSAELMYGYILNTDTDEVVDYLDFSLTTTKADSYKQSFDIYGDALYDDGDYAVYGSFFGSTPVVLIENDTDSAIYVHFDNVSVSGVMVYPYTTSGTPVYPGTVRAFELGLYSSNLAEAGLEKNDVDNISFAVEFNRYTQGSVSTADDLYQTEELTITKD